MRILCLIAARGGSKRVPGKNIRALGGKPLIVWSIEAARGLPEVCAVLVSTDLEGIATIAGAAGAMVPWLRPAELAGDMATSVDVSLHALDWYERTHGKVDGLLLLQPTSPFRNQASLKRGIELFANHARRPVIGVAPAASHPMWCYKLDGASLQPFIAGTSPMLRSQDLPPAYVLSGAFYLIQPADLRRLQSFCSHDMVPLVLDNPMANIDIDSEWDWKLAEALLAQNGWLP